MKYTVYYNSDKCVIMNDGASYILNMNKKSRHVWPEDSTEVNLEVDGDILYYEISNLSDRTQYLYDNNLLGIAVYVEEATDSWIKKAWKSDIAVENHPRNHCLYTSFIDSLSGSIDLNDIGQYDGSGAMGKSMYYIFDKSTLYKEPYRLTGYENVCMGIGRYYPTGGMRPHKMSNSVTVNEENKLEY